MRIAIIGAGWNGCHLALELTKAGHAITVLEKLPNICSGCSGTFGIRLHRGPHYPRSKPTRDGCHAAFDRFCATYPELVKPHQDSIYARGERDADGRPSKTSADVFEAVCFETDECRKVDADAKAIRGVTAAYDLDEPSVAVGAELRGFFERKLAAQGIEVLLGVDVQRVRRRPHGPLSLMYRAESPADRRGSRTGSLEADYVVNATGYQSLTPEPAPSLDDGGGGAAPPLGLDVVYQACIAFRYADRAPGEKPVSFIVMDGWFPCLMPSIDDGPAATDGQRGENSNGKGRPRPAEVGSPSPPPLPPERHYVLTHGSYTILGSFPRPEQAQRLLDQVCSVPRSPSPTDASRTASRLRAAAEAEICRFLPVFRDRFQYRGCQGAVLAKLRTECEFRSSVVFARDRVVYVFPGKISNIFHACDDVLALIAAGAAIGEGGQSEGKGDGARWGKEASGDCGRGEREREVVVMDGYSFVKSALADVHDSRSGPDGEGGSNGRTTCDLQTFETFSKREMRGSGSES